MPGIVLTSINTSIILILTITTPTKHNYKLPFIDEAAKMCPRLHCYWVMCDTGVWTSEFPGVTADNHCTRCLIQIQSAAQKPPCPLSPQGLRVLCDHSKCISCYSFPSPLPHRIVLFHSSACYFPSFTISHLVLRLCLIHLILLSRSHTLIIVDLWLDFLTVSLLLLC